MEKMQKERGPFPITDLFLVEVAVGAFVFWSSRHGVPRETAVAVGVWICSLAAGVFLVKWWTGRSWRLRIRGGPFPWRKFWGSNLYGVLFVALLAIGRFPVSGIELVAGLLFIGGNGVFVADWLRASSYDKRKHPGAPWTEKGGEPPSHVPPGTLPK